MGSEFPTARDATSALFRLCKKICADGYTVEGINPDKVIVRPDPPGNAMVPPEPTESPLAPVAAVSMPGTTGMTCNDCGNPNMVSNGACLKCLDCGSTNGCS